VVKHIAKLRKDKKKVVLASYSIGARERLAGLLEEHGLSSVRAGRQLAGRAWGEDRLPR
jgi:transcription-repair coupling factor (superfamily II helicase)